MPKHKKLLTLLVVTIAALVVLGGCAKQLSLNDMSPQEYEHSSGYRVPVPVNWQLQAKDEVSALFTADQGAVALLIVSEIGGIDYYKPAELAENLAAWMGDYIDNLELLEELSTGNSLQARQLWRGQDQSGTAVYADVWSYAAKDAVHYYMVLLAGGEDYYTYQRVFAQMIDNFSVTRDYESIYDQLDDNYHTDLFDGVVERMIEEMRERFNLPEQAVTPNDVTPDNGVEEPVE